jgi:hypothetical protein
MEQSQAPLKIPAPWAHGAGSAYINNPVPTNSQIGTKNGAASFYDGFPPNCFIAIAAGGAGPFGADFNGLLNQMTGDIQFQQTGSLYLYDSAFSSNLGGYPKGAMLQAASGPTAGWISLVDNNITDPDTGGAGWATVLFAGAAPGVTGHEEYTTPGTFTFTVPSGVTVIKCIIVGAGGGGGAVNGSTNAGTGGGAGGYSEGNYSVTPGAAITVVIGAGGAGGSGGGNGTAGSTTSIGSLLQATGGGGGNSNGTSGGSSGAGSNGQVNSPGGGGGSALYGNSPSALIGGTGGGTWFGTGGLPNGGQGSPYGTGGAGGGSAQPNGGAGQGGYASISW